MPELSKFNIEFNVDPLPLAGTGLERLERELRALWNHRDRIAVEIGECEVRQLHGRMTIGSRLTADTVSNV